MTDPPPVPTAIEPIVPDYGGGCLASVVPALLGRPHAERPSWLPEAADRARQVVLLVLDGLGWRYLAGAGPLAPTLASGQGGPITSVAPTTTATALTSIATGRPPAEHGIVGYRLSVAGVDGRGPEVMNVLRWRGQSGDLRRRFPPDDFQPVPAFAGAAVPVVTKGDFAATGFSAAHLAGGHMVGWNVASTLVVEVGRQLAAGQPLVYAYYDGLDKVAHQYGLGEHYQAELRAVDRLVGDLCEVLPSDACLLVTSDHGQVAVGSAVRLPPPELLEGVELLSGEGRFRWLHCKPGATGSVLEAARAAHGDEAWVLERDEMVAAGWFGGPLAPAVAARLGDVALVARAPVAFLDPADTGETRLVGRHGSLTAEEMLVPLVAVTGR